MLQEPSPIDAVSGILAAFDAVPLVALGEAHGLQEEADFLTALLHHPAFPTKVDDIVVEVGNALYQDVIDRFIAGEPVANADLRRVWRDIVGNPFGMTNAPIYEQFFRTVRAINRSLPSAQRLHVLLGDPPIDWNMVHSRADVQPFLAARDAHYAAVVEKEVLSQGRRALLVAGSFHFFRTFYPGDGAPNVIQIIETQHNTRTFVVIPHQGFGHLNPELEPRLAPWPMPTLARLQGTWLGALNPQLLFGEGMFHIGPDGERRPVDIFEGAPGLMLSDQADAYLYLGPRATLTQSQPNPAIYRGDAAYLAEIQRRHLLMMGQSLYLDALFAEQDTRYFDM